MLKRIVIILVVIIIGSLAVYKYLENKTKKADDKTELEQLQQVTKKAIAQLVVRTNAIDNWEDEIDRGSQLRLAPIMTIELEKWWLTERPILFMGAIEDISNRDEATYWIEIDGSGLRLMLQCEKPKVDSFLAEHHFLLHLEPYDVLVLEEQVAVIADIDEIQKKVVSGPEGEVEEIRIGIGKCIDIISAGEDNIIHQLKQSRTR